MKDLGDKVLSKIQNLITEIDKQKPSSKPSKKTVKRGIENVPKTSQVISPKVHNVSVTRSQQVTSKQMSYSYINRQQHTLQKIITQAYKVEHPIQPFKVTNKHSLWLLKQKQRKPIHDRLDQISAKKKLKLQMLQEQLQKEEELSMIPAYSQRYNHEDIMKKYRKMNQEQLIDFRQEYDQKNHERLKKKHCQQLNRIEKEVSETIPLVNDNSRSLSKLRNIKKNYSVDVFKRLNQDCIDRGGRKIELVNRVVEEEGGFHPVLCSKSRAIAQRSKNKHSFSTHFINSHRKCKTPPSHTPVKKIIKKHYPESQEGLKTTSKNPKKTTTKKGDNSLTLKLPQKNSTSRSKISLNVTPISTQRKSVTPSKPESDKNRLLNVLKDKDNLSTSQKSVFLNNAADDNVKTQAKKKGQGDKNVPFAIPVQQYKHLPTCPYHNYKPNRDRSPFPSSRLEESALIKSFDFKK